MRGSGSRAWTRYCSRALPTRPLADHQFFGYHAVRLALADEDRYLAFAPGKPAEVHSGRLPRRSTFARIRFTFAFRVSPDAACIEADLGIFDSLVYTHGSPLGPGYAKRILTQSSTCCRNV